MCLGFFTSASVFLLLEGESFRMGTFGRLVFCAVRTQLVGETSVSRQLSGCFFVQRDKLGAGVVVRKDLSVVRAVFGHVFRAVLR